MDSDQIDFKALRSTRNWTQDQMAEYLGVDRSTVSRLETGAEPSGPVKRLAVLLSNAKNELPLAKSGAAA